MSLYTRLRATTDVLLHGLPRNSSEAPASPSVKSTSRVAYYIDDIPKRDALLREIYRKIDSGVSWLDAIAEPSAASHGERVAEYAFVRSKLKEIQPTSIMDVGCVLNNSIIADSIEGRSRINFLNPSLEPVVYREYAYFKMPLNAWSTPLQFPLVTCLSTLEHVGFDNTRYGVDETDQGWDEHRCITEICSSVAKLLTLTTNGGTLIVSCPFGQKEYVCLPPVSGPRTSHVLHLGHVDALQDQPFSSRIEILTLRLCSNGWEACRPDAEFALYGSVGPGASGLILITGKGG